MGFPESERAEPAPLAPGGREPAGRWVTFGGEDARWVGGPEGAGPLWEGAAAGEDALTVSTGRSDCSDRRSGATTLALLDSPVGLAGLLEPPAPGNPTEGVGVGAGEDVGGAEDGGAGDGVGAVRRDSAGDAIGGRGVPGRGGGMDGFSGAEGRPAESWERGAGPEPGRPGICGSSLRLDTTLWSGRAPWTEWRGASAGGRAGAEPRCAEPRVSVAATGPSGGCTARRIPRASTFLRTRSACASSTLEEWLLTPMPSANAVSRASLLVSPSSRANS